MKQKFPLILSLLALLLAATPTLTSCSTEPDYIKQIRKQEDEQKQKDDATIQTYLTRHSLGNFKRLDSGIYLVSVTEGSSSNALITAGKKVTTVYVGQFIDELNEGQVFDASSRNRSDCGCFSFRNGSGEVIAGWDQATLNMRKGDRKLILIPSYLAYKAPGSGNIPPNTPLLFDMEILDVE